MSRYVYSLHDYHAVKRAVIAIDGITVLSGENGCGKSTLSKWLYYLVNGAEHFDVYIYNSFIRGILETTRSLSMVSREIDRYSENAAHPLFNEGGQKLRRLLHNESPENIDSAISIFGTVLDRFIKILSDYLKQKPSERVKDKAPANIQLEEEEVKLFKKNRAGNLFNLNKAIYVDTPMAVSEEFAYDNKFWDNLNDLMMYPAKDMQMSDSSLKIERRIKKLIKGQVKVSKDDFNQNELHYIREDGLDIKLDDVATGFKAFSYIQRLLENGHLNSNTLLMIDEPEAHLHPQWIVEFARLLVLLNKELGVKIMVASHNPDMVAAIHAISRKEERTDVTRFYIAEPSESPYTYSYRDLGNNIEDIFKSFNIAYERIEQYGGTGI